jgi:hypothetical protein
MLYKYCTTDGFDIINNSRLRLGRIDRLNDPFELAYAIDKDGACVNLRNEYGRDPTLLTIWRATLDDQSILYDATSPEDILAKFTNFQIADFSRVQAILRETWNKNMGIICLSEAMDVIQMWAHYTENHKGIVIGVEESEFVSDREAIVPVCYRDKMVLFPVTGKRETLDVYAMKHFPEVLGRKQTDWGYEKEVRLYARLDEQDKDGEYYIEIPKSAIREVYLGLRSDDTTTLKAKSIKMREQYRDLRIFKMTKHDSAFKLIPQEIVDD